jgi:chemotaxis-related protein WspB
MIHLLFSIGNDRYALESSQVVEVVPRVELWQVPKAPAYVAGVFRYRGQLVPVIDNETSHILGLMVERVTDTLTQDEAAFTATSLSTADSPYLGDTAADEQGMIHRVRVEALLLAPMRTALLAELGE